MPIQRLSAQEIQGFVIDNDQHRAMEIAAAGGEVFAALVQQAIVEHDLQPVVCEPGLINVTPTYWRRNRADYMLEVLPDGESALYHIVPKNSEFEPVPFRYIEGVIVAQDLPGIRSIRMPEETSVVPIMGPVSGDARLRVHEIIMHDPRSM